MATLRVLVKRVGSVATTLPAYASDGAAGMDLVAALDAPIAIAPGERVAVRTGLSIAVPPGYEGQIRPRSGLALRHGLTVANAPGTIDSDYRGEVQVVLVNLGSETVVIAPGDRMAQMIVAPVVRVSWEEVDHLPVSDRGAGGFGSTGVGPGGRERGDHG